MTKFKNLKKNLSILFFIFLFINGFTQVLIKPQHEAVYSYSGDNQTQTIEKDIEKPLRVLVLDENGKALQNYELVFTVISFPKSSKNFYLSETSVFTNQDGIASTFLHLGNKEGNYDILVKSANDASANNLVFRVTARAKSWLFFLILGLVGGISIFLYGMNILGKGMVAVAGNKMRDLISRFTKNRFSGLFAGFVLTLLVQSSTASSVLIIGFVESGLMSFAQSLSMILGAAIGTTVTAQLIALNITDFALLIIAIGFIMFMFSQKSKFKYIGRAILGLGFLFLGMYIISSTMAPLRDNSSFIELLIGLENPLIGIAIGFFVTIILNSTIAFIGILITIASQGFLSIELAIPLILGTNMGNTLIAVLASLKAGREAQRVALANFLFKFSTVLIFVWWIPEFANFVKSFSSPNINGLNEYDYLAETVPHQIANAHTIFNIGMAIIMLPLLNVYSFIIKKILPSKEKLPFKLKYINLAAKEAPALALSLAKKETKNMGGKIQELVSLSLMPFLERNINILENWQKLENEADFLQKHINKYLVSVSNQSIDETQLNEAFQIMYVIKELEMIGDIINTNLRHQATKWLASNSNFSEQGKEELRTIHLKTMKQISRSLEVFSKVNQEKVEHIREKYYKYSDLAENLEKNHYERLFSNNEDTITSSEIHLELLGLFNSINRHATNIAKILINWKV